MRVLVCSWGTICDPDIIVTLKLMGHDVKVLDKKFQNHEYDYDVDYAKALSDNLMNNDFDYVLSEHYQPMISRICNIYKLRYLSWIMDSPCFTLYSGTIYNTCNYIFIFDKILFNRFKDKTDRIFYLPLCTNANYWDTIKVSEEDIKLYATDVSFVGSLYEDKHMYNELEISDYLKGYLDGVIEAQVQIYGYNFLREVITEEQIKEVSSCEQWPSLGPDYEIDSGALAIDGIFGKRCTEIERFQTVNNLAKNFKFDVYTLSNTSSMPHVNNRGYVDYRTDMPKIFKCSKINLNMTAKTIESGIPLRIYDIMGSGGFVITNYQSELLEYFVPDEEIVIYESLEDLKEKIYYYLQHEEKRKKIAENGYKKVKLLYTYEKRLEQMFEMVRRNGDVN